MVNIEVKKGNTAKYKFQRKNEIGEVILEKADKIYFTVKEQSLPDNSVIQKTIDDMIFDEDGTYHFTIEPEDTENLNYGIYLYDIKVLQEGIKTTIAEGKFEIKKVVTLAVNEV